MVRTYRELIVWQKAMALAQATYGVAASLPDIERFGLGSPRCDELPSPFLQISPRDTNDVRGLTIVALSSSHAAPSPSSKTQLELARRLHQPDLIASNQMADLMDETGRLLRSIERALRVPLIAEEPMGYEIRRPSALSPQP
jgi:hypothetical protein